MKVGNHVHPYIMSDVWTVVNYDSQRMVSSRYLMLARQFVSWRVDNSINSLNQKS